MKIQVSGERVTSVREEMCNGCMCKKLVKDYWVWKEGTCLEEEFLATSYLGLLSCACGSVWADVNNSYQKNTGALRPLILQKSRVGS